MILGMDIVRNYKVEGNIIWPNKTMLTWGPFYYHSQEKAIDKMNDILNYIINWCDNAEPENITVANDATQIAFDIKVLNDDHTALENCTGFIEVTEIFFED